MYGLGMCVYCLFLLCMSDHDYHTIADLVRAIQSASEHLEKGDLHLDELDELCNHSRELYERFVVLRYKAMEDMAQTERTPFALNSGKPVHVSPNQTSLIDAIEEMNLNEELEDDEPAEEQEEFKLEFDLEAEIEEEEVEEVEDVIEEKEIEQPHEEPEPVAASDLRDEEADEESIPEEPEPPAKVVEEERPMKQGMSLNDLFTTVEAESLAEKLGKSPIDDLKKAIALNQKFLFINELFNGQEPSYQEAIAEINAMPSLEDAWNYLQLNHQASEWNREDEAVEQFAVLLQRRFMPS